MSDSVHRLISWFEENSVSVNAIKIDTSHENRITKAAKKIEKAAFVLEIPLKLTVTPRDALAGIRQRFPDYIRPLLDNRIVHATYLMLERGNSRSKYSPYIDALPTTFPTIPTNYSDELLHKMEPSGLLLIRDFVEQRIRSRYQSLCQNLPEIAESYPYEAFKWAHLATCSRNFRAENRAGELVNYQEQSSDSSEAETIGELMVPVGDMLNHSEDPNIGYYIDTNTTSFVMVATREINKGEELTISYGRKNNTYVLPWYGFLRDFGYYHDTYIRTPENKPVYMGEKIKHFGGNTNRLTLSFVKVSDFIDLCAAFRHIMLVENGEVRNSPNKEGFLGMSRYFKAARPSSKCAEIELYETLMVLAKERLTEFDEAGHSDESLLSEMYLFKGGDSIDYVQYCVSRCLYGERRSLVRIIDTAEFYTQVLRLPEHVAISILEKSPMFDSENSLGYHKRLIKMLSSRLD